MAMLMHLPIVVGAFIFDSTTISADGRFTSLVAYGIGLWIAVGVVALAEGHRGRFTASRR